MNNRLLGMFIATLCCLNVNSFFAAGRALESIEEQMKNLEEKYPEMYEFLYNLHAPDAFITGPYWKCRLTAAKKYIEGGIINSMIAKRNDRKCKVDKDRLIKHYSNRMVSPYRCGQEEDQYEYDSRSIKSRANQAESIIVTFGDLLVEQYIQKNSAPKVTSVPVSAPVNNVQ